MRKWAQHSGVKGSNGVVGCRAASPNSWFGFCAQHRRCKLESSNGRVCTGRSQCGWVIVSPSRASRLDSRCPKGPADHLVSFSAFLLNLCLQLQPYCTHTLQISKPQTQLSNSGGHSFSVCGHPSCLLTRGARTVTVVQSEGHAHRCSLACAQGGFEGL